MKMLSLCGSGQTLADWMHYILYMWESLIINVTQEDIEAALRYGSKDPILFALQRATGSPWCIPGPRVAVEQGAPYRTLVLQGEALGRWRQYELTGLMEPFEFEANFRIPDGKPTFSFNTQTVSKTYTANGANPTNGANSTNGASASRAPGYSSGLVKSA